MYLCLSLFNFSPPPPLYMPLERVKVGGRIQGMEGEGNQIVRLREKLIKDNDGRRRLYK